MDQGQNAGFALFVVQIYDFWKKSDINSQWEKERIFGENNRKRRENVDFCRTNDTIKGELLWLNHVPKE
ncbi:hypothetical protein [Jutongia sp.]